MCKCGQTRYTDLTTAAMSLVWGRSEVDPETGVVRWLGVRWYGVPYPVRLLVCLREWSAVGKDAHKPSDFDGCGCLVWLKDRLGQ